MQGSERMTIPASANMLKTLKAIRPELGQVRFQKVKHKGFEEALLQYEAKMITDHYKFGVLFCKENQTTEDEMYNNGAVITLDRDIQTQRNSKRTYHH